MSDSAPNLAVSEACISFTEDLLKFRRSVVTVESASQTGRDLYTWFSGQGAITENRAPLAVRSVSLGTTILQTSGIESVDSVVAQVKSTYQHYAR